MSRSATGPGIKGDNSREEQLEFRSGFVAVIGRPNTGKSTLINTFLHRKVAIVSDKPQTTRHVIRAIVNLEGVQMVFLDTPGYHKPHHLLGERLNASVQHTLKEVDAILFLVDAASGIGRGDEFVADMLGDVRTPVIVCVNKIDAISPQELDKQLEEASQLGPFTKVIPVSGLEGRNIDLLLGELSALMPPGPKYYPDNMVSDQPERVVAAEIIREKILAFTREEVPHSVAVEVEEIRPRENSDLIDIEAFVFVERESQKGIIIGKGGTLLRAIGTTARSELEVIFSAPVYLSLRVKVRKAWRKDAAFLARLGIR